MDFRSRRPRRTAEEQIASLEERAIDLEVKTRLVRVMGKLKKNPTILQDVENI